MLIAFMLRTLLRSPRRLLVGVIGVAIPVALFSSMAFFVDTSARSMTSHAIAPVQIDVQALVNNPPADGGTAIQKKLESITGIRRVEPFVTADLTMQLPGSPTPQPVTVFAVNPDYLANHPWVRQVSGSFTGSGVALATTFANGSLLPLGSKLTFVVPGQPAISLPVTGTIDLTHADTWFTTTSGDNQGNVQYIPNSLVMDYSTFNREVLPVLSMSTTAAPSSGSNSSATTLPAAGSGYGLQYHLTTDRNLFATDPTIALSTSTALRRTIERSSPGQLKAIDNLGDNLSGAAKDAINAKVLILFIGLPGVLVGGWLAIVSASFLAESRRRELALMNMRGLIPSQATGINVSQALVTSIIGSVIGLGLGAAVLTAILHTDVWQGVNPESLLLSSVAGFAVGLVVTVMSLFQFLKASKRTDIITQRRTIDIAWNPKWRQRYIDLWAIGIGLLILGINFASGGFKQTASEGQTLSLSFYLLLAPLALWIGIVLLGVRIVASILARKSYPSSRPERVSWNRAILRWLGRRPGKMVLAATIGSLAIAFGINLLTFIQTYDVTKHNEAVATVGADINLTLPQSAVPATPPKAGAGIEDVAAIYTQSLSIGTEKRQALIVTPASYQATVAQLPNLTQPTNAPDVFAQMNSDPRGAIISKIFAKDFNIAVGDQVTVTYPNKGTQAMVTIHILGIYDVALPTSPKADLIVTRSAFAADGLAVNPDFYLLKIAPGYNIDTFANNLANPGGQPSGAVATTVNTVASKEQNSLSTLNLSGLGKIETIGTLLIAALGIAVFGAFIILERRKEYAIIQAIGATRLQLLTAPALEGILAVVISIIVGVPLGLIMTMIDARVLTPLFTLSPPLIAIDMTALAIFLGLVVLASILSLVISLMVVARLRSAEVLREP